MTEHLLQSIGLLGGIGMFAVGGLMLSTAGMSNAGDNGAGKIGAGILVIGVLLFIGCLIGLSA